jgi:hypothetical protein
MIMMTGRKTREGWPLLTLEIEVNGNWKRTNERGPSLVRSLGLSCRYKRFLFSLGCSSRPSRKYFFPHRVLFLFLSPIALQAGQAAVQGRLFLSMCLWWQVCKESMTKKRQRKIGFLDARQAALNSFFSKQLLRSCFFSAMATSLTKLPQMLFTVQFCISRHVTHVWKEVTNEN